MFYPRTNQFTYIDGKPLAEYYIDAPSVVSDLPGLDQVSPGSNAYCVATQDVYILNSQGSWVIQ